MSYTIHHYPCDKTYHDIFFEVVHFIKEKNEKHEYLAFHWSRFEWMFARDTIDPKTLNDIIIFRNKDLKIAGMLIFEDKPELWFMIYDADDVLKAMMVEYAIHHLKGDIMCPPDPKVIAMYQRYGYTLTEEKDPIAIFNHAYFALNKPEGYEIKSLEEDYRLDQIHHVLWKGFNHGDDVDYSKKNLEDRKHMTSSPHFKKRYTYVAIFENVYVSYAALWYIKGDKTALIEPVATIPNHRQKGLAKAVIMHAILEAVKDGAKDIFVGSDMKFYKDIGFKPYDYMVKMTRNA